MVCCVSVVVEDLVLVEFVVVLVLGCDDGLCVVVM